MLLALLGFRPMDRTATCYGTCVGCRTEDVKLSGGLHCAECKWAISQRHEYGSLKVELEIKGDAIRELDHQVTAAQRELQATIDAAAIEASKNMRHRLELQAQLRNCNPEREGMRNE